MTLWGLSEHRSSGEKSACPAFQTAVQVLLWNILTLAITYKIAEDEVKIALNKMHIVEGILYDAEHLAANDDLAALQSGPLGLGNMLGGLILPTLVDSISEVELSQTSES
jgi:hypothetical protein